MTARTGRRGPVTGLRSPHPLGRLLPDLYEGDDFAQRFTSALDEVVAPAVSVLDCLDAYLDPHLAPPDFVRWLASCLGIEVDETLALERRRALLRHAPRALRLQGTAHGIAAAVAAVGGVRARVHDSGGTTWSRSATAEPSPPPSPFVEVRVEGSVAASDLARFDRAVAAAKPAHVAHVVLTDEEPVVATGGAA
jgi:phage tail-like protein